MKRVAVSCFVAAAACRGPREEAAKPPVVVATTTPDGPTPVRGSAGCGAKPGSIVRGSIDVAGTARSYVIELPASYDARHPIPLAYGFHGNWDAGAGARKGYRLAQAWGAPVVAVYPDGLRDKPDGPTTWAFDPGSRDFAFFDALHAAVVAQLCIDLDRVFVFGYSSGGFMANAIACEHGDLVRGVGAISAGLRAKSCARPVAAFLGHGEADDIVPYSLGLAARDVWTTVNGCTAAPTRDAAGCERFDCATPVVFCSHEGPHELQPDTASRAVEFFTALD